MFQPSYIEQPISSGKKILGFQTRKQPSFSLGWDQSRQLNSYQVRKGKDQQVTGKITNQKLQPASRQQEVYSESFQRDRLRKLYEQLSYQNPNIPPSQLQKYINQYEKQRNSQKPQSRSVPQQPHQAQQGQYQRRAPIKQKDSMKDILFNNVGVNQTTESQRAASRRNNSNLVLGNDYHYPSKDYNRLLG